MAAARGWAASRSAISATCSRTTPTLASWSRRTASSSFIGPTPTAATAEAERSPAKRGVAGSARPPRAGRPSTRLDVATIMLVTSPCGQYALLGRKRQWPAGRYSTLAGFCEVGETLEECCRRETYEESGVVVDPASVKFVASQPWPFPRSLMVGFQARAASTDDDSTTALRRSSDGSIHGRIQTTPSLPKIRIDEDEMQDIQWFSKKYVKEHMSGGSTALTSLIPDGMEAIFHIPGKASLARLLIARWTSDERSDE